jgi:TRAP-type C4-dicarboxylate transport system permease small subunit
MAFTEELTLYLFVWAVMMGTSIAFREGSNMAVTFLYDKFNFRSRRILDLFAGILGLFFFAVLMYFSVLEVMDEIEMNAMTEAIELPMWWFTGAMPIASAFILCRIASRIRKTLYAPPVE